MFEEALSIFSINFMKKSLLLHYYLKLLDNDHPLILNKLIRLLPLLYPLINNDKNVKLQITSELLDIKENVNDLETKIVIILIYCIWHFDISSPWVIMRPQCDICTNRL